MITKYAKYYKNYKNTTLKIFFHKYQNKKKYRGLNRVQILLLFSVPTNPSLCFAMLWSLSCQICNKVHPGVGFAICLEMIYAAIPHGFESHTNHTQKETEH